MTTSQFTKAFTDYEAPLLAFALKFTRDPDEANDLMQDTCIKAIRFLDRFQDGTNIKGWLFTIMRNTFINDYRKSIRKQALIVQESEISSANLMKSSTSNKSETSFAMADINKAISKLSKAYSQPFIRYVEGYKYEEIAIEFSIPLGTVKTRIHEARKLLKKQLQMYKERVN